MFKKKKIRTRLDLVSIPQSGGKDVKMFRWDHSNCISQEGKMSKRLGGVIGCKYKTSSWHLNGFPYCSNIHVIS